MKGTLIRWNNDRGFGFIKPETEGPDVFIHISTLKAMARKPRVGDVITFTVESDDQGKTRAENATIEGVGTRDVKPRKQKTEKSSSEPQKRVPRIYGLLLIIIIASGLFYAVRYL